MICYGWMLTRKNKQSEWEKEDTDKRDTVFACCKTARKPYDIMVQAVLIIAEYHFKDDIKVSSDGDTEDWMESYKLVSNVFGEGYITMRLSRLW